MKEEKLVPGNRSFKYECNYNMLFVLGNRVFGQALFYPQHHRRRTPPRAFSMGADIEHRTRLVGHRLDCSDCLGHSRRTEGTTPAQAGRRRL